MGNTAARPQRANYSAPDPDPRPAPDVVPEPVDPSWTELQPVVPMEPLELIRSETVDRTGTANEGLALEDAWEIAMTWREPLLNRVRLVAEQEGPKISIIDSVAWVRFKTSLGNHGAISIARAAAVAWCALASCPGYGGQENPVFWKCVFSELSTRFAEHSHDRSNSNAIHSLNDSLGFFDQPGHTFPRFMLGADDLNNTDKCLAGLRLFCGVGDENMDPAVKTTLDGVLLRLDPFIDHARTQQHAEVCLGGITSYRFAGSLSRSGLGSTLVRYLASVNSGIRVDGRGNCISHPPSTYRFRLAQLEINPYSTIVKCESDIDQLFDLLHHERVRISNLRLEASVHEIQSMPTSPKARLAKSLLCLDPNASRATITGIQLSKLSKPLLGPLMSALPFTTSLHSVDLSCSDTFVDEALPWLAYAMFHPDAPQSSWRALKLNVSELSQKSVFVMEAMARGNNLQALLSGRQPKSNGYYSARLEWCAVRVEPRDSADTIVIASDIASRVDVCGLSSTVPTTWNAWVAVVVPGFGLGWVRSEGLTDVQMRSPSSSSLISLAVSQEYRQILSGPEHLPAFIAPLGSDLRFLDIAGYCEVKSSVVLRSVLGHCPKLESFVVKHTGAFWSTPVVAEDLSLPRLRELELHIPTYKDVFGKPALEHLSTTLSHLEVVRVAASDRDQYPTSLPAIASVLRNASQLRYFHWQHSLRYIWGGELPVTYAQTRAWSAQLLDLIEWEDDSHLFVDDKSRVRCCAALLSVRDAANGPNLDRDTVGHIFQFNPRRTRRCIVVEPRSSWIQRDRDYRVIMI